MPLFWKVFASGRYLCGLAVLYGSYRYLRAVSRNDISRICGLFSRLSLIRGIGNGLRNYLSGYLSKRRKALVESSDDVRNVFRKQEETAVVKSKTHSHPILAENRVMATTMMLAMAQKLGRRLFMVQMSDRDKRWGLAGNRQYYWLKDTNVEAVNEKPTDRDLVGIVDTDYYMDMDLVLLEMPCPVILYTITPTSVGEVSDAGLTFHFNKKDEMVASIAGGAEFVHSVWNYKADVLSVSSSFGFKRTVFDLERRQITKHSSLVLAVPRHSWSGFPSLVAGLLSSPSLERLTVNQGEWNVMRVMDGGKQYVSIAEADSPVAADVPITIDAGLRATVKVSKIPVTTSMVESQLNHKETGLTYSHAALLCSYYRAMLPQPKLQVYPIAYSVKRFQWGQFDPDAKPSIVAFMHPMVHDAMSPDVSLGNEQRCVQKRVVELAVPEKNMTPTFLQFVEEFITKAIPFPHILVPVEHDMVWEKQNRPGQQYTLSEASNIDVPKRVVKAFQKKEAYGKFTDPRNISTINAKDKLEYSTILYAIAELMKRFDWYAFGMPPDEVAGRVTQICFTANCVVPSDYTRLDGTISNLVRHLEHAFFMRAFQPMYHKKVSDLMNTQHHLMGRGAFGTWYQTLWSRLSGSPETSCNNTLATAFVAFVAHRLMGKTVNDSWDAMGIYGGDDGLTPDVDPVKFEEAAQMMGLQLKAELVLRGGPGVHFLARMYTPQVWYGDDNSCCDLRRQLSKFHTCVAGQLVDPVQKLVEKGYSYYLTDSATPIIGPFVTKVKSLMDRYGIKADPLNQGPDSNFHSRVDLVHQYPNREADWFWSYAQNEFPGYDHEAFQAWLECCDTFEELLEPVCFDNPETIPPAGCHVDGEQPPMHVYEQPPQEQYWDAAPPWMIGEMQQGILDGASELAPMKSEEELPKPPAPVKKARRRIRKRRNTRAARPPPPPSGMDIQQ